MLLRVAGVISGTAAAITFAVLTGHGTDEPSLLIGRVLLVTFLLFAVLLPIAGSWAHEITHELERQMLASERLAAVGRLTAGIAHEINNPLGGMLTAINTWKRHGNQDAVTEKTLSLLERGLSHIRNTVAALLVETKTEDRPLEPADIEDLMILVEAEARTHPIHLTKEGTLSAPLPLPATRLRQILLNLLLNAVNAAHEGGGKAVLLTLHATDGMFSFSVHNDGRHISEEQMTTLFEPFVGNGKGHGLGLWIVYQIVRQLDGGILVESDPGHTTFTIEIPYAPVPH